jgi:hypothetical protein
MAYDPKAGCSDCNQPQQTIVDAAREIEEISGTSSVVDVVGTS